MGDLVFDLYIHNDERAMEIFRRIRWSNGLYCPKCNSLSIQKHGFQGKTIAIY